MKFTTTIIGTVGRDAELKTTKGGKKFCTFSVATKPDKNKTVWVNVTTWDKRAEIDAQYVKKGMIVQVEGTLQSDDSGKPRTYEQGGVVKVSGFELTGFSVLYLSKVQPSNDVSVDQIDLQLESTEIPF